MFKLDYLKYSLDNGYCQDLRWYYSILSPSSDEWTNNYYKVTDGEIYVRLGQEESGYYEPLSDVKLGDPILKYSDKIQVNQDYIQNIKEPLETTVGRILINYCLLAVPFGDKLPYINKQFSSKHIEPLIANKLVSGEITVDEYGCFIDNCSFLQPLSKVIIAVVSKKNIVEPDGLDKFKKDLMEKFKKEHGEKWSNDPVLAGTFEKELEKFDAEFLKDDPTLDKILTKKIRTNARKKMYLSIGSTKGLTGRGDFILSSLKDGYPKDNQSLASMFNENRAASFDRGKETQKGGAVAKELLRTAGGIKIHDGDCKSILTQEVNVTSDNADMLKGLYQVTKSGIESITDPYKLIGQKIHIRTPLYCNLEGKNFCSICVGDNIARRKDGVNILFNTVSMPILTGALKSMHDTTIDTVALSLKDVLK